MSLKRCSWADPNDELYIEYHDKEWGKPVHNDQKLFEFLILEGAQAGLSWKTILHKRDGYQRAFLGFDVEKVSKLKEIDIIKLKTNPEIVRNELKIRATITNAKEFIKVQQEYGSFERFLWAYVDHKPIINQWSKINDVPATTPISDQLSKDLKKRGFKFVGSTIIYAYMQAIGMVNDHVTSCICHPANQS